VGHHFFDLIIIIQTHTQLLAFGGGDTSAACKKIGLAVFHNHLSSNNDIISPQKLIKFVDYIVNAHHDDQERLHSLDVVLTVKHMLMFGCFESRFTMFESFALLVAGFIRDIAVFRVKNKNCQNDLDFKAEVRPLRTKMYTNMHNRDAKTNHYFFLTHKNLLLVVFVFTC
jgi:hypothetical protein